MTGSPTKAFVDTTVLADALVHPGEAGKKAKTALKAYDVVQVPAYAIKELKAGVLYNLSWMHNQFLAKRSFSNGMERLHAMSRTPRTYTTSTAIEAIWAATRQLTPTAEGIADKYGPKAKPDSYLAEEFRIAIKLLVLRAWDRRRRLGVGVCPLPCYEEVKPYVDRLGRLLVEPTTCLTSCAMQGELHGRADDVKKVRDALIKAGRNRPEDNRRAKALKVVMLKRETIGNATCRALGDAVFALYAPADAVILTTNQRDHEPLAKALGKRVATP